MEIDVVSPDESAVTIKITAEQIEQTEPDEPLDKPIEIVEPPETEEPPTPEGPSEQAPNDSPEPQPQSPQEDTGSPETQDLPAHSQPKAEKQDMLIIKTEKTQEQTDSE